MTEAGNHQPRATANSLADAAPERTGTSVLARWGRRGTAIIAALAALALLLIGATVGLAVAGRSTPTGISGSPGGDSIDAGFLRDMMVHHEQGVLIAHLAEQHSTDADITVMAYDIAHTQTYQIGQMSGFLALWDLPVSSFGPHMTWMAGSDGHQGMGTAPAETGGPQPAMLMPGMATRAELAQLQGSTGAYSDRYFLQLMVRHHQGGTAMMTYAADHASNPVVRNLAAKMALSQGAEISVMTQMLVERGAHPLPFDPDAPMVPFADSDAAVAGATDDPGSAPITSGR